MNNIFSQAKFVIPLGVSIGLCLATTLFITFLWKGSASNTVRTANASCEVGTPYLRDNRMLSYRLRCKESETVTTSTEVSKPMIVLQILENTPTMIRCDINQHGEAIDCRPEP